MDRSIRDVSSAHTPASGSERRIGPGPAESRGDLIAPGSGAVVMGTGIVSIALATDGYPGFSRALLGLAVVAWLVLLAVALWRLVRDRPRFLGEARSLAGLTGVAATAVLASRLVVVGWSGPAIALLIIAAVSWAILMTLLLPQLPQRASGQIFMLTVAAESLASLAASLAAGERVVWLVYPAVVLAALGLAAYPFALLRFSVSELVEGRGDQWVAGGSLAISSLALAELASAAGTLSAPPGAGPVLRNVALAVWVVSALWVVPLLATEITEPRLHYAVQRWATVFPLGMYCASAFSVSALADLGGLNSFARVWIWLAVVAWAAVAGGMIRRAFRCLRGTRSA